MNIPAGNLLNKRLFAAVIIFIVAFSIYIPSVNMPLINDEAAFLNRNEAKSFVEFVHLFDKKDYDGAYYRPLPNFFSGVISSISPGNAVLNRITNMVLHGINSVLLFLFVFYLFEKKNTIFPFIAAILFAVFPVNFIAVIWITDLFDRMVLAFILASAIYFLKKKGVNAVSLIFFALALICKEMAFSFPLIIIALGYYINKSKSRIKGPILNSVPYFIILAAFLLFRIFILDNNIFTVEDAHSGTGLITIIRNIIIFSGILTFPFYLKQMQDLVLTNYYFLTGIFILFITTVYLFRKQIFNKTVLVIAVIVLLSILPVSRLVMRWYLYLPSAFFAVLIMTVVYNLTIADKYKYIIFTAIIMAYTSTLIIHQVKWTAIAVQAEESLKHLTGQYEDEITNAAEIEFLTIPAKVDEYPLYQLAFDVHFNNLIKNEKIISVKSKSFLKNINDNIDFAYAGDQYILRLSGANYFTLLDIQKNSKLADKDFISENNQEVIFNNTKEPHKLIFTFSNGRFIKF